MIIINIHLPVEITREIFSHLLMQHKSSSTCKFISSCLCWQLDLLSVAMVCKSWYSIAVEFMLYQQQQPWLPLLNYASHQRTYPFRSRLVKLIAESKLSNLIFHHSVRHLVIDFASFDTIRREKTRNNIIVKRKVHHGMSLSDMVQLFKLCLNTERLDIICDAGFVSLLSHSSNDENNLVSTISVLVENIKNDTKKIKRLDLIGFNPIQRCSCCAGRNWDKHLSPLIQCLELDTLVLQHILPSEELFETIVKQKTIKKIILYKSLITIPPENKQQQQKRINSINRIPKQLWNQITGLYIYEDIEDAFTWPSKRYLYDLVENVGPQLQVFKLQFGTKGENESSLLNLEQEEEDNLLIRDPTSILHVLKTKCKDSLRLISLINQ